MKILNVQIHRIPERSNNTGVSPVCLARMDGEEIRISKKMNKKDAERNKT
jgi:hypothetical protein